MYNIRYDGCKKRLYITITSSLDGHEADEYTKEVLKIINGLPAGFTVCADLSQAEMSVLENSTCFQNIRNIALAKGLKKAVTIISEKASDLLNRNLLPVISNVFIYKEEAEKYLDE
jgi:hypothetical protein